MKTVGLGRKPTVGDAARHLQKIKESGHSFAVQKSTCLASRDGRILVKSL